MATIESILKKFKADKISLEAAEELIYDIIRKYKIEISEQYDEDIKDNNERLKEKIRENCDHEFGGVEWYTACNGSKKCRKCGYEQDVYERD